MKHILTAILMMMSVVAMAQAGMGVGGPRNGNAKTDKSKDTVLQSLIKTEVPKYKQLKFYDEVTGDTIDYNLFIPKDYDPSTKYPLLLFMADGSTTKKEVTAPLTQGYGALEFVTDGDQQRHPSFVLVPQFQDEVVVNDTFYVSKHVGSVVRLMRNLQQQYNIDSNRLYTTGQSTGGMISFYLNINYPDLFAASLFVSSQWDTTKMASFGGKKFFYIVAGGDEKAPKGMAALGKVLDQNEAEYHSATWSARLSQEEQEDSVKTLLAKGGNIYFVTFTTGSVLSETAGGNEHMCSFDYAYKLQTVRDWLFDQRKNDRTDSLLSLVHNANNNKVMVNAYRGDWHGTIANSIRSIQKAEEKGAVIVTIELTKDSAGEVIADTYPIAEEHHAIIADRNLHLTLKDILSFAKGNILVEFPDARQYLNEIREAAQATGTTSIILLGDVASADMMYSPTVDLDKADAISTLQAELKKNPVVVNLRYSNDNNANLLTAIQLVKGKARIGFDTSSRGKAGSHKDVRMHGDYEQSWGQLIKMGGTVFVTEQIKPFLRWLPQS